MSCIRCRKKTDERYIIDIHGKYYCSEDCMEQHFEEHELCFDPHPYEDTYLILRRAYIDYLDHWEDTLNKKTWFLEDAVDDLWEEIDELNEAYVDFVYSEGDDGAYAWEIYQYTSKLRELQKGVLAWRPSRNIVYWVSNNDDNYGSMDEQQKEVFDKIFTELYLAGYEDFILSVVKHHQHPYHWGLNYVFEDLEEAEEAFKILKPYCDQYGVEISLVESFNCEAHCGDVLEADADTYINGFFYCYSCKESEKHGVFTLKELEDELTGIENNNEDRQALIEERSDWVFPFKRKIKRSCRTYGIEIPLWAE